MATLWAMTPEELTDFRQDAVSTGLAMLERHNGCCIADVVGRGKTRIGAEIRRRLAIKSPQAGDSLVVCLPRLAAMWERICDRFGLGQRRCGQHEQAY